MAEKGAKSIERNREGVPMWDGDPSTFTEFSEMAAHWEQSVAHHKRYLCGPKLQAELSGSARRYVMSMKPGWISFEGGVQRLLEHLRMHLGQPQLSEMSDFMNRYFKTSRRRRDETMNDYITRKAEPYMRACQSLDRVQKRYDPGRTRGGTSTHSTSRTPSRHGMTLDLNALDGAEEDDDGEELQDLQDDHEEQADDPWSQWNSWWQKKDWHSWSWQTSSREQWQPSTTYEPEEPYGTNNELLPSFVQGWFLLQDAGLDPNERNMILAALRNDFSVNRVAQELRNQWTDEDVKRRDQGGRASAWSVDLEDEDEDLEATPDLAALASQGINEEGVAMFQDAEDQAQEALVQLDRNRRTLREARAKQHFVKMSRQFYRSSNRTPFRPRAQSAKDDGNNPISCLACGGNHRTSACPKKTNQSASMTTGDADAAPFVCYAQDNGLHAAAESDYGLMGGPPSTSEAVCQGKAIIDGGATRTLGSVHAVEQVMSLNQAQHGHDGLCQLDESDRPTFAFGNSSSDQCLSTAWLKIQAGGKPGQLKIHTLDKGQGPILFSIETLRALGAVIDYEHDLVTFRKLDPKRIIELERSSTGHQLLPLTEDWFKQSQKAKEPVPSLKHYI